MTFAAVAIFAATYLVIAIGKLPGYQLDRAGGALLGCPIRSGHGSSSRWRPRSPAISPWSGRSPT
jgi:hypothetical protein